MDEIRIEDRPDDEVVDELVEAGADRDTATAIVRIGRQSGALDRIELPPSAASES